jgi:hypothetical protein
MNKQIEKGRPARISYKQWDEKSRSPITLEADARFHCWGIRKPRENNRAQIQASETVGICELADGAVRLVQPEKIKFLDKI